MTKTYSAEYREEALKLVKEIGRSATSKKLGISVGTIDNWKEKTKIEPEESGKKIRELEEKIRAMEKEMTRIRKENEFLEDAASFFAASRQKSKQN